MSEKYKSKLDEVISQISRDGLNARLELRDETPLIWAVSEGYPDVAIALINAGADLNARNSDGNTALLRSACEGRPELTRVLIDAGAQLNIQNNDGYTALILARRRGHEDIAELLLQAGADKSLVALTGSSFFNPGHSPKVQLIGPRDATLEAHLLALIHPPNII
jgi:ankyrin repeat protein